MPMDDTWVAGILLALCLIISLVAIHQRDLVSDEDGYERED